MNSALVPFSETPVRLVLAVAAGAAIGLNRWFHHKPAGLGTHSLVALGAALASTIGGTTLATDAAAASRIVQGLVTGVGFIGAGVIMRANRGQQVHGLTTAASIWTSAILGIACGLADFTVAASGLTLALIVLLASKPIEDRLERLVARREQSRTR